MKAINLSALKYAHPNTATAIIFGLGTGMRVGEYAEFGLRVIRDELNSPEGRYRRELARIDREYPGHTVEERRIRMVRLNEADDRLEEAQARALNPGDYLQDLEQTEPESQLGPLLDLADEVEDGE